MITTAINPEPTMSGSETDLTLSVVARDTVADGVVRLTLTDPQCGNLPPWAPGAHIDLVLGPDLVRQYSLCGDSSDRSVWQIAVLDETDGRGGSRFVHEDLHVGASVQVRGPRNHFHLERAARYLFIAGGIGITPILPMIDDVETRGADWRLFYGGRRRDSMAFADQLSRRHPDRVHLQPQDEGGLLDLGAILSEPADDTLIYSCGPEALLDAVEKQTRTWPTGALHVERFAPRTVTDLAPDSAFEVELRRTGATVRVEAAESVLDAIRNVGVPLASSCEEGTCGTCEVEVIEGAVDHRDSILTKDEQEANDTMFVCVSRASCQRLVLDI